MRINVVIRYLNASYLFEIYMDKDTAQDQCKTYINKILNRLKKYKYRSYRANPFYECVMFPPFLFGYFFGIREENYY